MNSHERCGDEINEFKKDSIIQNTVDSTQNEVRDESTLKRSIFMKNVRLF